MNNKPVIIGSAEAGELRRRLERLEAQVSALIDTVEAYKGVAAALQTICDTVDGHEARLNAMAILKPVAVEHKGKVGG